MISQTESNENVNVSRLHSLWRSEVNCPEVLPFQAELIQEIHELLTEQQSLIDEKVSNAKAQEHFTVTIYQMEIERIRYSLARYMRTRLIKIQKNLEYILNHTEMMNRLSNDEQSFALRLNQLNNSFFVESVSSRFEDPGLRKYYDDNEDRKLNAAPKLNEFVFCKALESIEYVQIAPGQHQDIEKDAVVILQYSAIQREVLNGRMMLL